jgi:hypothetical protein
MPITLTQLAEPLHINVSSLAHALSRIAQVKYEGPDRLFPNHEVIVFSHKKNRPVFLEFSNKTPDGFYEIASDYTGEEIYCILSMLKETNTNSLREALIGTPLEFPNLHDDSSSVWAQAGKITSNMIPMLSSSILSLWSQQLEQVISDKTTSPSTLDHSKL